MRQGKKMKKNYKAKVEKYIENGMHEDDAKRKANIKMLEHDKHLFFEKLRDFLLQIQPLRNSRLLKNICEKYDSLDNMTHTRAMKKAIRAYETEFDDLFDDDIYDESEVSDDDENSMESD